MSTSSSQLRPPATPTYILRGHAAPIHGLHIFHQNLHIISGDAEGWIIVWDLVFKRPVAVWKAHEGAILEVKGFNLNGNVTEVYTHGRDHKLRVWKFSVQDEDILQKTLPVDLADQSHSSSLSQPWLVHSLPVNALNFCAFSMLFVDSLDHKDDGLESQPQESKSPTGDSPPRSSVLIAVPNALDSGAIDLFHLPRERRVCTIPAGTSHQTGMVMAVNLFFSTSGEMHVASAYEDGHVMVFARRGRLTAQSIPENPKNWKWEKLYSCRPHSQPVLSLDVNPTAGYFISSSADAALVKHPIPGLGPGSVHARPEEDPLKTINTKHAGQQGLRVRSDGKIFATAGWDSRIRVYSCKTMKELAVLKWHKEGCYSVAFADVCVTFEDATLNPQKNGTNIDEGQLTKHVEEPSLATVHRQRNQKVQKTHWLAAGSKDGKISLWDIY
ncbi:WD40-repeat-containing domain protein [Aspergillus avenaceus]|uniref:ASTRA-associated protein 1 n=1 Tax=Aspergillus avenaceus TaxID=36643 RepID=A0A5N6TKE1_ASPAV|nr:WD40-repeat-containing domain protein [Aspergillus avenaceus]